MEQFSCVQQVVVIAQLVIVLRVMQDTSQTQIQLLAFDVEQTASPAVLQTQTTAFLVLLDPTFHLRHAQPVAKIVLPAQYQLMFVQIALLVDTSTQDLATNAQETALLAIQGPSVQAAEWDSVSQVMPVKAASCHAQAVIHLTLMYAHHASKDQSL